MVIWLRRRKKGAKKCSLKLDDPILTMSFSVTRNVTVAILIVAIRFLKDKACQINLKSSLTVGLQNHLVPQQGDFYFKVSWNRKQTRTLRAVLSVEISFSKARHSKDLEVRSSILKSICTQSRRKNKSTANIHSQEPRLFFLQDGPA